MPPPTYIKGGVYPIQGVSYIKGVSLYIPPTSFPKGFSQKYFLKFFLIFQKYFEIYQIPYFKVI